MKTLRFACIGSREIDGRQQRLAVEIGKYLAENGHIVASGNAVGADFAFQSGANSINPSRVMLYLPWKDYNKEHIIKGNLVSWSHKPQWESLAAKNHPAWQYLTQGVKKLMTRNVGILNKADICLAFLNHNKKGGGGTGMGWRLAEHFGIPRLDLAEENLCFAEVRYWINSL